MHGHLHIGPDYSAHIVTCMPKHDRCEATNSIVHALGETIDY